MPRSAPILALLLSFCWAPVMPCAHAVPRPHPLKKRDFKHEIAQLEEQWRVAQLAGDAPTMEKLLSDDYVGITINGMVNTKTQQLDRIRNRTLVLSRMDLSDTRIRIVGPVAVVTCKAEIEGTNEGTTVNGAVRYTRVYQRVEPGVWKITNFEVTRAGHAGRRVQAENAMPAS